MPQPVLQARAPELLAQDQRQVQGRVVNQDPFQDIFPSSKVNPSHAAGFQTVSEGSASMPQQLLAARIPAFGIDSLLFYPAANPVPTGI